MTTSPNTTPTYVEEPAMYAFQQTFTANQSLKNLPVAIDTNADFLLTGIHGFSTGLYTINFRLPGGRQIANNQIRSDNMIGTAQQPAAIGPAPLYRANTSGPLLDITDVSGATNVIEIIFTGIRRLKITS